MLNNRDYAKKNQFIIYVIKILSILFIVLFTAQLFLHDKLDSCYKYKDYNEWYPLSDQNIESFNSIKQISHSFIAKGNILNKISVYLGDSNGEIIDITITDASGNLLSNAIIDTTEYQMYSWNQIDINITNLVKDESFIITFSCENGLNVIGQYQNTGQLPIIPATLGFTDLKTGNSDDDNKVSGITHFIGLQFCYRYLTLGSIFELILKIAVSLILCFALCYAVFKIETLLTIYQNAPNKNGFLYALYFSISFILLYNPLENIRNELTTFDRIIGSGLTANIDVSKRISNFYFWFVWFAVVYVLFYLLSNTLIKKVKENEDRKVISFLDHFMVLANCDLFLRCITYFKDESSSKNVYYFSSYVIMLTIMVAISYIILDLKKCIVANDFAKMLMCGASVSYPITILLSLEWDSGKVLAGVLTVMAILILLLCRTGNRLNKRNSLTYILSSGVLVLPLLPFITSTYIELIHILNQHSIFVAYPAKHYKTIFVLVIVIFIVVAIFIRKKHLICRDWRKWSFPWFLIGISCLSVQIPISSVYYPDLFEGANYSVLISDFFNYGTIPIVEHYGGHMMTSVWEGILYGFINHDYTGAIVSPYSAFFTPLLVILFYCLIAKIWNRNIAFFVTLLFPFYGSWSYFGLGTLICLAVVSYIRKNSYRRAWILWTSFVWCSLYRLDLGFAFGFSIFFSMIIYIINTHNWHAGKQLVLTLLGWILIGFSIWFIICFIKGINPANRLIEFLMINLSNQNWSYGGIGNTDNTIFSWSYIIMPFLMIICLLYTIFSKHLRETISQEQWIILLIFGCSYFGNFSRGLVRHTLAESTTLIVIWCGYLFLAIFFSCYKNNQKLFLPAFMILILCNTLFLQDSNYTALPIADGAVSKPATVIESWKPGRFSEEEYEQMKWTQDNLIAQGYVISENEKIPDHFMTYWEQLKESQEVVERVKIHKELETYVNKYKIVLDTLLDENTTYIDFINKSLLYSLLGKKSPVYVSQSPLQLSGEFTQKEFIKEMKNIPIVLMPVDTDNYRSSNSLDGIANAYRYYKVAEYIYQNYVPLCKYDSDYAVWCLAEQYEVYKNKITELVDGTEYIHKLTEVKSLELSSVKLISEGDATVVVSTGTDPIITELQRMIDISPFINQKMLISIVYKTNQPGPMQLFYTTEQGENYTGQKVATVDISDHGTAVFSVPITEYTRLRLDTPEDSTVTIVSLKVKHPCTYIDYGYDGPVESPETNIDQSYEYISALHQYNIRQLPWLWAEYDKKNANDNGVLINLTCDSNKELYMFDSDNLETDESGNYLKISATYDGTDTDGLYSNNDELLDATVILGYNQDNQFIEKCRYAMKFKEGTYDYLIRCSADYYWYLRDINAVKIQTDGFLHNVKMQILKGD